MPRTHDEINAEEQSVVERIKFFSRNRTTGWALAILGAAAGGVMWAVTPEGSDFSYIADAAGLSGLGLLGAMVTFEILSLLANRKFDRLVDEYNSR